MPSAWQTSSVLQPATSRSSTTVRWRAGRVASARSTRCHPSSARTYPSGSGATGGRYPGRGVSAHGPISSGNAPRQTDRASRERRVRAVFTRIRISQVLNDDRASNPSMWPSTASQVSWTTSSAAARLATWLRATRSISGV